MSDGKYIVTKTPFDNTTEYRHQTDGIRLHLGSRGDLTRKVYNRWRLHSTEASSEARPFLPFHDTIKEALIFTDERRAQEVGACGRRLPNTTSWPLESQSPLMYGREDSVLSSRPVQIPALHVENTPNDLHADTKLTTTVDAQAASEEIARVHAHDVSTLLYAMGNLRAQLETFLDGGVFDQQAIQNLKGAEEELRQTGAMVSTSAAETLQLSVYNRRWSLLHGARPDIKRVMLTAPIVGCLSATGAVSVVKESEAVSRAKVKKERKEGGPDTTPAPRPEDVIDIGENREHCLPPVGAPSTALMGQNFPEDLSVEDLFRTNNFLFNCDEELVEIINSFIVNHESGPDSTTVDHPTELDSRQFWHLGNSLPCFPFPH